MDIKDVKVPKIKLPKLSELPLKLKLKLNEYKRVFKITKKPSMEEFKTISKVAGIGTIIIGMIGFIIYMVIQYIT